MSDIGSRILFIRDQRVILDVDLARVYGVKTSRLNEQVKRNIDRFPDDFCFQLTERELGILISQNATSSHGGLRKRPFAFTEHGCIMAANVLKSKRAAQMSVFVVRAFIKMRRMLTDNKELARRLAQLEKELKKRLDVHETAIVGILQRIMDLIDPPPGPEPTRKQIGFSSPSEEPD